MARIAVAVLMLCFLAACKDYGDCRESHTQIVLQYTPIGIKGSFVMIPQTTTICDRYEYPAGDGPKAN